ncbi:hypothetical protein [Scytonema sp. NUACC26]|uniref:hypothetical protein n=1 Tax=Scytonema sp. NUACC26 TaxID=3140176 RepID=UPI0038B3A453
MEARSPVTLVRGADEQSGTDWGCVELRQASTQRKKLRSQTKFTLLVQVVSLNHILLSSWKDG